MTADQARPATFRAAASPAGERHFDRQIAAIDASLGRTRVLLRSGHACPSCDGIGSVRIRTGNGSQRLPCRECGGAGTQRPGPRRDR